MNKCTTAALLAAALMISGTSFTLPVVHSYDAKVLCEVLPYEQCKVLQDTFEAISALQDKVSELEDRVQELEDK